MKIISSEKIKQKRLPLTRGLASGGVTFKRESPVGHFPPERQAASRWVQCWTALTESETKIINKKNNMKKCIFILTVSLLTSSLFAETTKPLSLGLGGGYANYNTFRGELYLKFNTEMFNRNTEMKFGLNNHSYHLTFDNVSDLNASSIGLFGDIAIYPFNKGFFAGLRWEALTFNWLSANSRDKIERERGYTSTSLYTGTNMLLQLGYNFRISDNFGVKLFAQPGIQQYRISNGSSSSGSFVQNPSGDPIIENQVRFIYNVNLSLEIRLK